MSFLWLSRTRSRSKDADEGVERLHREGAHPLIDVFICTYNEGRDVLLPTITGALHLEYDNKRVWVLDDSRRDWLRSLCEETGCGYITREDNEHAKAGNINNGLKHVAKLARAPDYIAVLDADFVCESHFLERTLGLMHFDDKIAIVQTPQHFSDPDPIQRNLHATSVWPDEQRYFFDIVMSSRDAWNAAFCCGTSSLIRFSALQEIGGVPTESVTEDYLLSLRLRELGLQTIYLNERLSVGRAPEGLKEYIGQRSRWCLGFVQIIRSSNGPFCTKCGISWIDRLTLIDTFLFWSATHAFRLLSIIVPPLYLLLDIKPVHAGLYDAVDHVFPFLFVIILVNGWLTKWRVMPIMSDVSQILSAHAILKSVAIGLVKPKGQTFKVTLKGGDRKHRFVQWPMMIVFLGYLTLTMFAVFWGFVINNNSVLRDSAIIALIWCWYNAATLLLACFVCIEDPRQDVRVHVDGELNILQGSQIARCSVIDVSLGGVRLAGECPFELHSHVGIALGKEEITGQIARVTAEDFAVKFDHFTDKVKLLLLNSRSAPVGSLSHSLKPHLVAGAVIARAFR